MQIDQGVLVRAIVFAMSLMLALPATAGDMPQVPAQLAPTHGYVYVAFPKGGGDALTVSPLAGGKDLLIDTVAPVTSLPAANAFAKWLPAGRYRVKAWGAYAWSDGPEFDVQAGRPTDLGELMPVNVGGYQFVVVPVRHPEHAGSLAAALAPIAGVLKDPTPLRYMIASVSAPITIHQKSTGMGLIADLLVARDRKINKPSTQKALIAARDPDAFLHLLRGITPPLQDEPARLADGTLFFPADLGQLRKRTPDGEWSSLGIDTLRQVLAVESANDRLVAGSDDGHLRASRDGGATWTALKSLGRLESIIDIDHADGTWVVTSTEKFEDPNAPRGSGLIAAAKGTPSVRLRVYVGHGEDLADLAVAKTFTLAPKDQVGWLGAHGQLVDGRYYLLAGTGLQRLDLATGQWSAITPGPRISSHRVDPSTGVVSGLWSQGAFSKLYVSSNHGDTWTQIGRPPYVIHDVQMDGVDRGWASRWNINSFGGTWETYTFVPAKNDWDRSGEAPFNCRLMRIAADIPVLCFAPDASILGLHDGKWEAEFSAM